METTLSDKDPLEYEETAKRIKTIGSRLSEIGSGIQFANNLIVEIKARQEKQEPALNSMSICGQSISATTMSPSIRQRIEELVIEHLANVMTERYKEAGILKEKL